jgi:hypothetical protein
MSVLAKLVAIGIAAASVVACGGVENEDQASSAGDPGSSTGAEDCGPHPDPDECPTLYDCVDGTWVEVGQSLCTRACPADEPSQGDACEVGPDCAYPYEGYQCDSNWIATWSCTEAGWTRTADECDQPNLCGYEVPSDGEACQVAAECEGYLRGPCESATATWDCVATSDGMAWVVEIDESGCPPL